MQDFDNVAESIWFGEELIRPCGRTLELAGVEVVAADEYDGQIGGLVLQVAEQIKAGHSGHAHVGNDQAKAFLVELEQCVGSTARADALHFKGPENVEECLEGQRIIVNDQDFVFMAGHGTTLHEREQSVSSSPHPNSIAMASICKIGCCVNYDRQHISS